MQVLTEDYSEAPLTVLVSGTHDISGNWSAQTTASEIWLVAGPGATFSGVLKIDDGAPPIHVKGFEITAHIDVEALAPLEISDCKFRRADSRRRLEGNGEAVLAALVVRSGSDTTITNGDFEGLELAIHVQGGTLVIAESNFRRNHDSIYVTNGLTRIVSTNFGASNFNGTTFSGTALRAIGGDVVLKDKTVFLVGNKQLALNISDGARVTYELPAPLGRYAFIQDSSGIYHFEPGEHRGNFPFACPAGTIGESFAPLDQSNPGCSRVCPEGYYCGAGTTIEKVCESGTFCPEGSPATQDCPAGTVGMKPLLPAAADCEICPNGTRCPKGSAKVELCGAGTHAPKPKSESCTHCEKGKYQDEEGKASCKICGPGNVCPSAAIKELECLPGTWSSTPGLANHSQCKNCPLGMYCPATVNGTTKPTPCPAGTVGQSTNLGSRESCTPCTDNTWSNPGTSSCDSCKEYYYLPPQEKKNTAVGTASVECLLCLDNAKCSPNVTLETIELDERWWRLGPRSQDLHRCDQNDETKFTPCSGGNQSGADGSGYCHGGYKGPLCQLCTDDTKWYNPQSSKCEECPQPGNTIGLLVGMAGGVLVLLTILVLALKHASQRSSHVMRARNGLVLCARRMHHLATAVSLVPKFKVSPNPNPNPDPSPNPNPNTDPNPNPNQLVLAFYQSAAVRTNTAACP